MTGIKRSEIRMGVWIAVWILVGCPAANAEEPNRKDPIVLWREGFDDSRLLQRGWYDGQRFKIAGEAYAGSGCIEYHWKPKTTSPDTSSGVRRLFEPTDTVYLRFHIRLSKGWSWTGRSYHPHMMHFMTTENGKYRGPAASHLTLYIEPQNGKLRLAARTSKTKTLRTDLPKARFAAVTTASSTTARLTCSTTTSGTA